MSDNENDFYSENDSDVSSDYDNESEVDSEINENSKKNIKKMINLDSDDITVIDDDGDDNIEEQNDNYEEDEDDYDDYDDMQYGGDGNDENNINKPQTTNKQKKTEKTKKTTINPDNNDNPYYDEDDGENDEDDEDDENYLQKFDSEVTKNYILDYHPECLIANYDEILVLSKISRDEFGNIVDAFHKTLPFLTKYEKTRIIGQRAKQINSGAQPFIKLPESIIDGSIIAELELIQKRIPFIIRRPLPNGTSEYWNVKDLEVISF